MSRRPLTTIPLAVLEADLIRRGLDPDFIIAKYSDDQPRVPAGSPDGGQFAPGGGAGSDAPSADRQAEALRNYLSDYVEVNAGLRESGEITDMVKALDAAIHSSKPLTEELIVYRGMTLDMELESSRLFMKNLKKGYDFSDKGFVSTTTDLDIATRFATEGNTGDTQILFKIALEAGTRVADVPSGLSEKLLPRGTGRQRFKVSKIKKGKEFLTVEARWIE